MVDESLWDDISEFLKAARVAKGYTQAELGQRARVSEATISNIEQGRPRSDGTRPNPRPTTWRRIAYALGSADGPELLRVAALDEMARDLEREFAGPLPYGPSGGLPEGPDLASLPDDASSLIVLIRAASEKLERIVAEETRRRSREIPF